MLYRVFIGFLFLSITVGCNSKDESLNLCSEVEYLGKVYQYGDISREFQDNGATSNYASGFKDDSGNYIVHNACGYALSYSDSVGNNPVTHIFQFLELGHYKNTDTRGASIYNAYGVDAFDKPHTERFISGDYYDYETTQYLDRGEKPNFIEYGENRVITHQRWYLNVYDSDSGYVDTVHHRNVPNPSSISSYQSDWYFMGSLYKRKDTINNVCTYFDLANAAVEYGACDSLSDAELVLDQVYFDLHKSK